MEGIPSVEDAILSGFCTNRDEYHSILRDLSLTWSQEAIRVYRSSDEARLIKLVLILRDTDLMMGRISEQIESWQKMTFQAGFSGQIDGIAQLSEDLTRMKKSRAQVARDISARSEALLPNCSAIVGPLVAARLLAQAGSLLHLAQMPASAIQILGARKAFFSHRVSGTPPPKFGCIYEHKRIHAAPKKIKGKVSRAVASSLAVAARIDCFRGTRDQAYLEKADLRIRRAGIRE
jgi:nucleolar protein 56